MDSQNYYFRAIDNSMSGDGIMEGDIAMISSNKDLSPLNIALILDKEGSMLLRRILFCPNDNCILIPSGEPTKIKSCRIQDIHILGKVIGMCVLH